MRVVVVGNGMVGARFVDELASAMPAVRITVLGKENTRPYNRVLLSSVVAGDKSPEQLITASPTRDAVTVLTGVAATEIDRARSVVVDDAGAEHPYDHLVLASGSSARIPPIQGVAEGSGLVDGVFVLKDLADAEGIVRASARARRPIVLGAGVLGLEVATGLASRGPKPRVVHFADRLMERQLGWEASAVVAASLRGLGIEVHTGASIARVNTRRGRMASVRLEDGSHVEADMLVMCCGTVPETNLARRAGLDVDRGVVVDRDLRCPADSRISAIGDCAEPPTGMTGLVATGWEQAARLARRLAREASPTSTSRAAGEPGGGAEVPDSTSENARAANRGPTDVVRVKAWGLKVTAMGIAGDFDRDDPRWRVVTLNDPAAGRFVEVVVSGGILAGATVVGDASVSANLSALYSRSVPMPTDPAQVMIRALGPVGGPTKPSALADGDLVCTCNSVTAGVVRRAISGGCDTVDAVAAKTRASTGCGDCASTIRELLVGKTAATAAAT